MSKFIEKWEKQLGVNDENIEDDIPIANMNYENHEEEEEDEPTTKINSSSHIPLIEPIKERREFSSPEEFDKYYQQNKTELDQKTTHKLNKMFNIPGYRITKLKGVLSLKNIPQSRITSTMRVDALELKVNEIKDRVNACITTINNVLDKIG